MALFNCTKVTLKVTLEWDWNYLGRNSLLLNVSFLHDFSFQAKLPQHLQIQLLQVKLFLYNCLLIAFWLKCWLCPLLLRLVIHKSQTIILVQLLSAIYDPPKETKGISCPQILTRNSPPPLNTFTNVVKWRHKCVSFISDRRFYSSF